MTLLLSLLLSAADAGAATPASAIALPGTAPISMDYLAFDEANDSLWVPAGSSGRIDVIDGTTGAVHEITGQPTVKRAERVAGPSSASVGEGVVFVGSRADSSLCAFDAKSRAKLGCVTLDASPDGVAWVAPTREVWVTTPREKRLVIVDAKDPRKLAVVKKLDVPGEPEGYAVDAQHGWFVTNLEDGDATLTIDLATREVRSTWKPGCGEAGPRGVAVDPPNGLTFVACTDGVRTLDATGKVVGSLTVGKGVDNIDWSSGSRQLYVASGAEATLAIITVDARGALSRSRTVPTSKGCRTVVAAKNGRAWLPDSANGRIVLVR